MKSHSTSFDNIAISNPKLYKAPKASQESRVFPYYAGYSNEFSSNILSTLKPSRNALVFDPWNGSGTTTTSAYSQGFDCIGFDLNPAMVLVAKARLLSPLERPSLISIAKSLIDQSRLSIGALTINDDDPLLKWFNTGSTITLRSLETRINNLLISNATYIQLNNNKAMDQVSSLAAFFYVALFRTTRKLLLDFIPSNPTWVKQPKTKLNRKRPSQSTIHTVFLDEIRSLSLLDGLSDFKYRVPDSTVSLKIGNAENIALNTESVDAIISSPPYCTRIDYAVSTAIELAIIRCEQSEFDILRRGLTGTSTVQRIAPTFESKWGSTCALFLERLYNHQSQASKGYYFKNHLQYFSSLSRSVEEISRILKPGSPCFLVVQDSHYKEIHNDVPTIVTEMANHSGLTIVRRDDFKASRSMVDVNLKSKKYLNTRNTTESVLCFQKN